MSILFFTKGDKAVASSRHRVWLVAERLGYKYKTLFRLQDQGVRKVWRDIYSHELLFVHKSLFPWKFVALILYAQFFLRKRLVYDLDDAQWEHSYFKTLLLTRFADRVFCGSHVILKWALHYNAKSVLIPTVVDHEIYARYRIEHRVRDMYTIGWTGTGRGHFLDGHFAMVRPALWGLYKQGIRFRLVIIGGQGYEPLKNYFKECPFETIIVEDLDWTDPANVPRTIHEYAFDVGLMPTSDTPFNRAKCALKAIEYMACGVPTVASDVGEARYLIQNNENGFLARTAEKWASILSKLMADEALRSRVGANAQKTIQKNYSFAIVVPIIASHIAALSQKED